MPESGGHSRAEVSRKGIALPVLGSQDSVPIRRSKNAPRRAVVLGVIQLLIIAHVIQWWITGSTVSPIEPSEAMEFGRRGVINPGFIFFIAALLGTLFFGRWMCGWGCHMVMLQDLCGWIMKKFHIRPRPFRSRLLVLVPLILGLYMFVWPAFYRLAIAPWTQPDLTWPGFSVALTTGDFWQTFPGVGVAIPFLLICGFATVYFLGSKGFCTYACPYGGFFRPLDELSPARIRVTDACAQCGHCTAVCSSNVRVHEEVREYGMVVDTNCMKCLDCVSVCPNDALYFGFGKPAIIKGAAKHAPPRRKYDLSLSEEIAFALVFALIFFAFRGDVVRFPLLMVGGLTAVLTFMLLLLWRMIGRDNVNLHRFLLKQKGRLRPAGLAFAFLTGSLTLLSVHSGAVNLIFLNALRHDTKVKVPLEVVFASAPSILSEDMDEDAILAIRWYRRATSFREGGFSLRTSPETLVRLAWLESCRGDFDAALEHMSRTLSLGYASSQHYESMAMILGKIGRAEEAARYREWALVARREAGSMAN